MKIDNYGKTIVTLDEAFDFLYSGKINSLEDLYVEDKIAVNLFNKSVKDNADNIINLSHYVLSEENLEDFDKTNHANWFMPKNYQPNLISELYDMCHSDQQRERVTKELELFIEHKMFDLLFYLKYLVDTMRQNNIVWGVGRGSSVASYVLYLIGVHKIDSIKYNLDINEFLK